jgi:ketol-acid reductoisomerase
MAKMFYDKDADIALIANKRVAIIGYGSQGHAHALNLHDSGVEVRVGLQPGSASRAKAEKDGLTVLDPAEASRWADVIMILTPDHSQAALYRTAVEPNLAPGKMLMFAHGFNIRFGSIVPPAGVDVTMIAPKSPGHRVRELYKEGGGTPALLAVHQDATGHGRALALSYGKALGVTRAGVVETTFAEETETDLFGEQAVLCGGTSDLVLKGFETLVEAGYQPEVAYYECLHELKLIVDLLHEGGLTKMHKFISDTAKYGDLTRGPRVVNDKTKKEMGKILKEIQKGKFAKQWIAENAGGRKEYNRLMQADLDHQLETVGKQLRARMPWLEQGRG